MNSPRIRSKKFLLFLIFLLPIMYLGGGFFFSLIRLAVSLLLLLVVLQNCNFKNKVNWPFLVFLCLLCGFVFRGKLYVLPSLIIFGSVYLLVYKTCVLPSDVLKSFVYGSLCTGLLGFLFMLSTNTYIKGGEFTEGVYGISNLVVPLCLCLFIVYDTLRVIEKREKIVFHVIINVLLYSIVFFLEKRGPMVFCLLSIALALIIKKSYLRKGLLLVIFAYPFYEIPITQFLINNNKYIEKVFERSNDYDDLENNPRIKRLLVSQAFVSDMQISDLWGYHKKLVIADNKYDRAHDHFHNAFLQLYYERGALSVSLVFLIILQLGSLKESESWQSRMLFSILCYLFLIGTNESLLQSGTAQELLTTVSLLLANKTDEKT